MEKHDLKNTNTFAKKSKKTKCKCDGQQQDQTQKTTFVHQETREIHEIIAC